MIGHVLVDDHLGRGVSRIRVDGVQLQRPGRFGRTERGHVHRGGLAFDERAGGDHLADVEPGRAACTFEFEFTAQRAEGDVGDARHGCEDHGAVQLE